MSAPTLDTCRDCGARDINHPGRLRHDCGPNTSGYRINDAVVAGGIPGVVVAVGPRLTGREGHLVEVYFRSNYRSEWFPSDQLTHEAVAG